jgi:hypothetical protein
MVRWTLWLVQAAASFIPAAIFFMCLAFHGEGSRGHGPGLDGFCVGLAAALCAAPVIAAVWIGARRLILPGPAILFWLPLALTIVGAPSAAGLLELAEVRASKAAHRRTAADIAAIRRHLAAGDASRACELVNMDPKATPAEMAACRSRVDAAPDAAARWRELQAFVCWNRSFNSWNVQQLGLSAEWDWSKPMIPTVPAADQEWFLKAFFESWLARPDALSGDEDVGSLQCKLDDLTKDAWSPDAVRVFAAEVLPKVRARLKATPAPAPGTPSAAYRDNCFELLDRLERGETREKKAG